MTTFQLFKVQIVMMLLAILVRIKIRDGFLKTTPAILYCLANGYLALFAY